MAKKKFKKGVWLHDLHTRLEKFSPDTQCQYAAKQEHGEAEPKVEGTDVLVVSC